MILDIFNLFTTFIYYILYSYYSVKIEVLIYLDLNVTNIDNDIIVLNNENAIWFKSEQTVNDILILGNNIELNYCRSDEFLGSFNGFYQKYKFDKCTDTDGLIIKKRRKWPYYIATIFNLIKYSPHYIYIEWIPEDYFERESTYSFDLQAWGEYAYRERSRLNFEEENFYKYHLNLYRWYDNFYK